MIESMGLGEAGEMAGRTVFSQLDKKNDGTLSASELLRGIKMVKKMVKTSKGAIDKMKKKDKKKDKQNDKQNYLQNYQQNYQQNDKQNGKQNGKQNDKQNEVENNENESYISF